MHVLRAEACVRMKVTSVCNSAGENANFKMLHYPPSSSRGESWTEFSTDWFSESLVFPANNRISLKATLLLPLQRWSLAKWTQPRKVPMLTSSLLSCHHHRRIWYRVTLWFIADVKPSGKSPRFPFTSNFLCYYLWSIPTNKQAEITKRFVCETILCHAVQILISIHS